jgi:hypothetical protein
MKVSLICAFGIAVFVGFGEGITWIITPVVVVAVLAAGVLLVGRSVSVASRTQTVHVHGSDWADAARHEAGHAGVARKVGGRVTEGVIRQDGTGYVVVVHKRSATPADYVAVSLAGGYREGVDPWHAAQCSGDRKNIAAVMGSVPWGERAAVRAEAVRIGRGPGIRSGYASSVEARLKRTGRL